MYLFLQAKGDRIPTTQSGSTGKKPADKKQPDKKLAVKKPVEKKQADKKEKPGKILDCQVNNCWS